MAMLSKTKKRYRVAVVELITGKRPMVNLFARLMYPSYSSVMPTVVAVWLEQLGHHVRFYSYTGFEDLLTDLPTDVDIVFISANTQSAYLAYALANYFRTHQIVTVLGGPHARAYPDDAALYFDYVLGLTDQTLIEDIMKGFSLHPGNGVQLSASANPTSLPGLRHRWKYIRVNLEKARWIRIIPVIGALGCPYSCYFCPDAENPYKLLPEDQIRDDLMFLQTIPNPPAIVWCDPNFGVRFNTLIGIIESTLKRPGAIDMLANTSLSLLTEQNMKRLHDIRFKMIIPAIESWFGYNHKTHLGNRIGIEKVKALSEHFQMISRYVPIVQCNFVFGLDEDSGSQPFELTKEFISRVPQVYPNYMFVTVFGTSSLIGKDYLNQGRIFDIPFHMFDLTSITNCAIMNYSYVEFLDRMIDLLEYTFSPKMLAKRFISNEAGYGKWMWLTRGLFAEKACIHIYHQLRNRFVTDPEFKAFFSGSTTKPPEYFYRRLKKDIGNLYAFLPKPVIDYFKHGEPYPNTRIWKAPRIRVI